MPVLLLMLLAILDLGRAIYAYSVISNSAREAARYGTIAPADSSGIEGVARGAAGEEVGLDPTELTVQVDWQPAVDTIRVTVSYNFRLITPLVASATGRSTLNLESTATMYLGY